MENDLKDKLLKKYKKDIKSNKICLEFEKKLEDLLLFIAELYVPKTIKQDLRKQVINNTLTLINQSIEHYHFKQSLDKIFEYMIDFIFSAILVHYEDNNIKKVAVKRIGSKYQFVIPAKTTRELGVEIGGFVDIYLLKNCIVIKKSALNDLSK